MEKNKKVFIIILNFNRKKDILDCLHSVDQVKKLKSLKLEVVVVDNGSTDGSVKAIKEKFPQVKIIVNSKNFGFAKGNNIGIRYALNRRADYCVILNNDTFVDKNFLVQLIKVAERNKKIGLISPKIYFAPGFEYHYERYQKSERGKVIWYAGGKMDWNNILASHRGVDEVDKGQYDKTEVTDFSTGCCMLIRTEFLRKIGLFDEKYFLYWEDNDLSQRLKKAGYKVYFCPQAFIWHKNASLSGSGSKMHDYYLTRNRFLFGLKYARFRVKLSLIKESLIKLFKGREGEKMGILDFYLGRWGKGNF